MSELNKSRAEYIVNHYSKSKNDVLVLVKHLDEHDADLQQRLALKDLEIMRLREALLKIEFEYDYTLDKELTETIVAGFELARATPTTYDDLMAWHEAQLGEPAAWMTFDFYGNSEYIPNDNNKFFTKQTAVTQKPIPLYAKKG